MFIDVVALSRVAKVNSIPEVSIRKLGGGPNHPKVDFEEKAKKRDKEGLDVKTCLQILVDVPALFVPGIPRTERRATPRVGLF